MTSHVSVGAHHDKHHYEYEEQVGGGDPQVIPEYGVDNSYHQQGSESRPTWPGCGVNLTLSALLSGITWSFSHVVYLS